jgi:hypothetical protein
MGYNRVSKKDVEPFLQEYLALVEKYNVLVTRNEDRGRSEYWYCQDVRNSYIIKWHIAHLEKQFYNQFGVRNKRVVSKK